MQVRADVPRPAPRLFESAVTAWSAMLEAIEGAQRTIHLEVYAFSDRGIGARFLTALREAARRGVQVRVIVDGWGSLRSAAKVISLLREAGCDASVHNRLFLFFFGRLNRNHRKLLLVDGDIAIIGGINIGDEFASWEDVALEVRGAPSHALARRLDGERYVPQDGPVRIHLSRPGGGFKLRRLYAKAFSAARTRVTLAQGYFLPDGGLVKRLVASAHRGAEVRMLLPARSDVPLAHLASASLNARLHGAGIRVFEWNRSILHAKVAVIDGRRLLIGSFNLDPFSLVDLETLAIVDDEAVAASAERWIAERIDRAMAIPPPTRWTRLAATLGRVVVVFTRAIAWLMRARGVQTQIDRTHRRDRRP